MTNQTCIRCNGKGYLVQFKDINGGECFKCNATGKINGTVKLPKPDFRISDEVALKNAFIRINKEESEKKQAIKNIFEQDRLEREAYEKDKLENPDDYIWDFDDED